MGIVELLLLSVGLAMDAFAVSVCKGLETRKITIKECLLCGIWFGGFQGLMPFIGFILGSRFEVLISKIAPWLAFGILAFLGTNMVRSALSKKEDDEAKPGYSVKTMFLMAVATSIDALAIGITFVAVPVSVLGENIWINTLFGCGVICAVTFIISAIGVFIGNIFGAKYKSGAEAVGGIVLILIGIKILGQYLLTLFGVLH